MHPTDSHKYERVHKDGRRERSSANSSRKTRDEYPLNCCTRKCGAYVGFDLTKMWIWSGIVSISTISTSSSSAFSRISSLSRDSTSGVRPYLIRHPAFAHKNPTRFSRGSMSQVIHLNVCGNEYICVKCAVIAEHFNLNKNIV